MTAAVGPTPFGAPTSAGPGMDGFSITPSDSTNFASMVRCIYVGVTGDVSLVTSQGTNLVFKSCPAGLFIPVCSIRVNNTNTTAAGLIGIV